MRIIAVTQDGRELIVKDDDSEHEVRFCDLGDAAGDLNGGDFLGMLCEQHPEETIVEFRIRYPQGKSFRTSKCED